MPGENVDHPEGGVNAGGGAPTPPNAAPVTTTPESKPGGSDIPSARTPVTTSQPKTYTEKELQDIIHSRTKDYAAKMDPYKKLGEPDKLAAELKELREIRARLTGQPDPSKVTNPEDPEFNPNDPQTKKFLSWMKKAGYDLEKLKEFETVASSFKEKDQKAWNDRITNEGNKISEWAKKEYGYDKPEQFDAMQDLVSQIIYSGSGPDAEGNFKASSMYQRWIDGDPKVLDEAFKSVHDLLVEPMKQKFAIEYSATKEKTGKIPRPAGGSFIPAPVTTKEKLTDDQRSKAAFARLAELSAKK